MKKILIFLLIFSITVPCFAYDSDISEYLTKAQSDSFVFGDESGDLHGDDEVTRAEFLAIAVRFWELSGGENVFSDVSEEDWFCKEVAAANACGIFFGTPEGEAKPRELIKTEDAISVIGRYYNASNHKGRYSSLSAYAESYFGYAFESGFFAGWKRLPNPRKGITKNEVLSLFYRYKEKNEQSGCFADGYPKLSDGQRFNDVSVDVMTKTDCEIAYALREKNSQGYSWTAFSETAKAGEIKTIQINADINKIYDIYVRAESKTGERSQISEIRDISPLAFIKGDGTESRPYVIYTERQLRQMAVFSDKSFLLGNNIKISGEWTPIKDFEGVLDGNGYRIEGINIQNNSSKAGLFENIKGGTVKNLAVDAIIEVKETAGIIAGENEGTIEGCTVTGSAEVTGGNCGGICGINSGKIVNCLSCLYSVKAGSFAGGIAGQNYADIENCLSAAETVVSDMYSGGIAGINKGGVIYGCVAANIAVYNTMTHNGGKISTNRKDGVTENNYSFSDMVSNSAKIETDANSRNGLEVSWDTLTDAGFYYEIGWDGKKWKKAEKGFTLVCPKNTAEPLLESGRTAYQPKGIYTADELIAIGKNANGHYVLMRDITLNTPWKTINLQDGFSGTLDGNGHTVNNLVLKGETGMFSNITGGTVKNLKFRNVKAMLGDSGGIITACNYGYIENCTVSGQIETSKAECAGAITGENNGQIENCTAEVQIKVSGADITVGGICALNRGVVSKSAFSGNITVTKAENSVIGGICGIDSEGYISESVADLTVLSNCVKSMSGGVCGVAEGTQIYKCAGMGSFDLYGDGILAGGICGIAEGAAIYNCFSQENLKINANNGLAGGICGRAEASNIQNTYSSGEITLSGDGAVAGGICGMAQDSFITQNVSLNPQITAQKTANSIVGESKDCDISDNYSCNSTIKNTKFTPYGEKNGNIKSQKELLVAEFYLKPLSGDGLLGWDEEAWEEQNGYLLPVLTDTPLMDRVQNPAYK